MSSARPSRAAYGAAVLEHLAEKLTAQYGRGFSRQNLDDMRRFYLAWPIRRQTLSAESIRQTASAKSEPTTLPLNSACAYWTRPDENPPVGTILCAETDEAVVRYALDGLPNNVLAAEHRTKLAAEKVKGRRTREDAARRGDRCPVLRLEWHDVALSSPGSVAPKQNPPCDR